MWHQTANEICSHHAAKVIMIPGEDLGRGQEGILTFFSISNPIYIVIRCTLTANIPGSVFSIAILCFRKHHRFNLKA